MTINVPEEKHDHHTLKFPENFLWGGATSAHQVEGNNIYNDWWDWEQRVQPPEKRSEQADDQYHLYKDDFKLAKELGHNSHRLSVEWSRIEPIEGQFNQKEIDHYIDVLKDLKEKGFTVMLTLNHFTLPLWMAKKGGYEGISFPRYFVRFVKRVVPEFKDYVDYWITINEPQSIVWMSYLYGAWPPQKKSNLSAMTVYWNLAMAHRKAYKIIHQLIPKAQVGITTNANSFNVFHNHRLMELLTIWISDLIANHLFISLSGKDNHDFFGLDYYFNSYISLSEGAHIPKIVDIHQTKKNVSDMGWEIYPEGIFEVIMDFSDYKKPIIITENGLASTNDDRRIRFLLSYLQEIYHAISSGADVRGYFHWSLIDNFELADGFTPRFGLIEVDYPTQERRPRGSALVYKEIIKNNGIPHYLMKFLGHRINAGEVLKEKDKE